MKHEEAFYLGYVTKTRGLKGEVQVFFEFEAYRQINFEVMHLEIDHKLVPYFVSSVKLLLNKTGYFYFQDIDHIDKAVFLVKKKIYLPLSQKPQQAENDFFYSKLLGFLAVDKKRGKLGKIIQVNEYPQQFVATILCQNQEVLVPLNEDFIIKIEAKENILTLDLPEGLLDIYLA